MDKKDVAAFFDSCAPWWDDELIRDEEIVTAIFAGAGIREGMDVLDVACGTGVLLPDYLKRGVASVTAIDLSPEMAKIAREKFPDVTVICGDVETEHFGRQFDAVMVYNAFPHFPRPARLIEVLAGLVKPGGKLTVAHGMSRAALTDHHRRAGAVSIDLPEARRLADMFAPWFEVDVMISTDRMYQVSGVRRDGTVHSHGGYSHSHSFDREHQHETDESSMEELLALMKFMVKHNDAHAQELAELADKLRTAGKNRAFRDVMDAATDFDMANARLAAVLKVLSSDIF